MSVSEIMTDNKRVVFPGSFTDEFAAYNVV